MDIFHVNDKSKNMSRITNVFQYTAIGKLAVWKERALTFLFTLVGPRDCRVVSNSNVHLSFILKGKQYNFTILRIFM